MTPNMHILTKSKVTLNNGAVEGLIYDIDNLEQKSIWINNSFSKRALDIFISVTFLLFIFSWLFPLIALFIKATSSGPVLFIQKRIGYKGIVFDCLKFRTMYFFNTGGSSFAPVAKGDSRITKVGKYLRMLNLDELPQVINVLKGEMSIVGPRPHAIAFHEKYSTFIEYIDNRHLVKPGITGLAQVNGFRGDVEDEEKNKVLTRKRILYDIQYINEWSIKLDIYLIFSTFWRMLKNDTNGH